MGAARISVAGLMTIVVVVALDCATFVHGVHLPDRSPDVAIVILVGVLPVINVVGIAMLLMLRPRERREGPTKHLTSSSGSPVRPR